MLARIVEKFPILNFFITAWAFLLERIESSPALNHLYENFQKMIRDK
jgi:hypothetical protein